MTIQPTRLSLVLAEAKSGFGNKMSVYWALRFLTIKHTSDQPSFVKFSK